MLLSFNPIDLWLMKYESNAELHSYFCQKLIVVGHEVANAGLDDEKQIPLSFAGSITTPEFEHRSLASCDLLSQGACGGPVLLSETHKCIGMVEGVFPRNNPEQKTDTASIISSEVICKFLEDVERCL